MVVADVGLVRAEKLPGFTRVSDVLETKMVGIVSGEGWIVEREDGSREPLVAWVVFDHTDDTEDHVVYALPMVRNEKVGSDEPTEAWTHQVGEPVRVVPAESAVRSG